MRKKSHFLAFLCTVLLSCSLYANQTESEPVVASEAAPDGRQIVAELSDEKAWLPEEFELTKDGLADSIELLRIYFLNNQKKGESWFEGDYFLNSASYAKQSSLLTQTFGVAGLAELATHRSNPKTREMLVATFGKLMEHNRKMEHSGLIVPFLQDQRTPLTVPALVVVSMSTFITEQKQYMTEESFQSFRQLLSAYMQILRSSVLPEGGWGRYMTVKGFINKDRDAYIDGLCLLAYVRAVKLLGMQEYDKELHDLIPALIKTYLFETWQMNTESSETADFALFGMTALQEYAEIPNAKEAKLASDAVLTLGWWLIHSFKVEHRVKTNGLYVASLCSALEIARQRKSESAETRFKQAIETLLRKQMLNQLGHEVNEMNLPLATVPYASIVTERLRGGIVNGLGKGGIIYLSQNYWNLKGALRYLELMK